MLAFPPTFPADVFVCATAAFKTLIPCPPCMFITSNRLCGCLGREFFWVMPFKVIRGCGSVCATGRRRALNIPARPSACGLLRASRACAQRVSCLLPLLTGAWKSRLEPVTLPSVQPGGVLNERQVMLTVSHNPTSHEYFSLLAELLLCCTVRTVYSGSALEYNW